MKTPTSLDKVVPKYIRKKVYKEALKYYEEFAEKPHRKYIHRNDTTYSALGLCLLLPCIMWNLDDYLCNPVPNERWDFTKTSYAFPEIEEYIFDIEETNDHNMKLQLRIKALTLILISFKIKTS